MASVRKKKKLGRCGTRPMLRAEISMAELCALHAQYGHGGEADWRLPPVHLSFEAATTRVRHAFLPCAAVTERDPPHVTKHSPCFVERVRGCERRLRPPRAEGLPLLVRPKVTAADPEGQPLMRWIRSGHGVATGRR